MNGPDQHADIEADTPQWNEAYAPPPWSAVEEEGVWKVVCDGYNDETPTVFGSDPKWPMGEADANIGAASLDLLAAAKLALPVIQDQLAVTLQCHCLLGPDLKPDVETLDEEARPLVERLTSALEALVAAVLSAGNQS